MIASAFAQAEEELDDVANDFAKQLEARKLSGEVPPPDRVRATTLDFIEAVREAEAEGLQVEIELDE